MNIQSRRILGLLSSSKSDWIGLHGMRIAIAIVFLWIGFLKYAPYEADSITPFVANNPVMSLFYAHPDDYRAHLTHEGELVPEVRAWQAPNGTYSFSDALVTIELVIGLVCVSG